MFTDPVRTTPLGSRAMSQEELAQFLSGICYGTLSFMNDGDWPDARPMNFSWYKDNFYFHANKVKGEKLAHLPDGGKVCISFYEASPDVGKRRFCQHDSVLVYGRVYRIDNPEMIVSDEQFNALTELCYSANTAFKADPERLKNSSKGCSVFKVVPEHMVGKLTMFTARSEMSYLESLHSGGEK